MEYSLNFFILLGGVTPLAIYHLLFECVKGLLFSDRRQACIPAIQSCLPSLKIGGFAADQNIKFFLLLLMGITSPLFLFSLNGKPEKVSGHYEYKVEGSTEILKVQDKTILEYLHFNIEKNETTRYEQPHTHSTLLCRVKGRTVSHIRGKLEANGKLLFINPSGIIFSETAHVNVGTLIASTLDIQNDYFLNNRFKFELASGSRNSCIENNGRIEAVHTAILLAPQVTNRGMISAKAGTIALGGGEKITLDFEGDKLIQFVVDDALASAWVEQAGKLHAARVWMKLPIAQHVIQSVLNTDGVVEAGHVETEKGVIRLKAGSSTEACWLDARAPVIEVAGDLKVEGECNLKAPYAITWLKENTLSHLHTETHKFVVEAPLRVDRWISHVSGAYFLESAIQVSSGPLVFDAPVFLNGKAIALFTKDSGRSITFQECVRAQRSGVTLDLSAGSGDVIFKKEVTVGHLNIHSAHNVETDLIQVDRWTQKNVRGITTIGGDIFAKQEIALQSYAFNLAHSLSVEKGALIFESEGHLKSNENTTLTASSIEHRGPGDVFLGGKWIANRGGICVNGMVHLLGGVEFEAPEGDIVFNKAIAGLGWLDSKAQSFVAKGEIGRISYLDIETKKSIRLSNVGRGEEGILGALHLHTQGPIFFDGTDYVAEGYDLTASHFEFNAGKAVAVFNPSIVSTIFQGKHIHIGDETTLNIRSAQGSIEIPLVQGGNQSNLFVTTAKNQLAVNEIKSIDHLLLSAQEITLQGMIRAGSIQLAAQMPIKMAHFVGAQTGDLIVDAPLHFTASGMTIEALHGNMQWRGMLLGDTELSLNAPEGEILMKERLGYLNNKFKRVTVHGTKIVQYEDVISSGPIHYTAQEICLGRDLTSDHGITLDGAVTLIKNNAITLRAHKYRGPILLNSTLDADEPTRALHIQNGVSRVEIKGSIGKQGPLGKLVIHSDRVILHSDIGGAHPGIIQAFQIHSGKQGRIDLKGSWYHTGEQFWDTGQIHFTGSGPTELKTAGHPLIFGKHAEINLDKTTSFSIHTQGGALDLAGINSGYNLQPLTIQTEKGDVKLHSVGDLSLPTKISNLYVEGRTIKIRGFIKATQIFMEADTHIEYETGYVQPTLRALDSITLNARNGRVGNGANESLISVETSGKLMIGAKTAAYLKGTCQDQYPRAYPLNPPPRTIFNGQEYQNASLEHLPEEDALLKTLTPALSQKTPTFFMDRSIMEPRKAPIYYDTSSR